MPEEKEKTARPARTPGHLEKEEAKLWRLALLFMVLLATGLAALSWERLQNLPYRLGAVPVGLLALAILFAVYSYGRKKQVAELNTLLRGLQERVSTPTGLPLLAMTTAFVRPVRVANTSSSV